MSRPTQKELNSSTFPLPSSSVEIARERGGGERGPGRHSEYRVVVRDLPAYCSWQDLKDFARDAGEVVFADVDRRGGGVLEFRSESDMQWALKNLDGRQIKSIHVSFRSPGDVGQKQDTLMNISGSPLAQGEPAAVTLIEDRGGRRSRSPERRPDDRNRDDRDERPREDDDYRRD